MPTPTPTRCTVRRCPDSAAYAVRFDRSSPTDPAPFVAVYCPAHAGQHLASPSASSAVRIGHGVDR